MNCPLCGLPTPTRLDVHGDISACVRALGLWRAWVTPYLEKADAAVREMKRRVGGLPPSEESIDDLYAEIAAMSMQVGDLAALVEGRGMVMREVT